MRMKKGIFRMWLAACIAAALAAASVVPAFADEDRVYLGGPGRAYWGAAMGMARWESVEHAKKYEVRLYENGAMLYIGDRGSAISVTGTSVDLSVYMADDKEYSFEVRAVPTASQEKKYYPGEWIRCEDTVLATGRGDTDGRFRVYSDERRKYEKDDGQFVVGQWYLISGSWYYFDQEGFIVTGWLELDDAWYYLDTDGAMLTGWQLLDGNWYYLGTNGVMRTGWVQSTPGVWYYLDEDGSMVTDTVIDGYQLDSEGIWRQ